jgi:hypothetical protein
MFSLTNRVLWIVAAMYAAPLVVYIANFGFELSSDHTRWAEFGSAMAGLYAPIVALTTLAVLLVQVGLQKQINIHEFTQAQISQARADIEFFAAQLSEILNKIAIPGHTFRSVLHSNFQPETAVDLDSVTLRALAANIDANSPSVMGIWSSVYPILAGLAAGETKTFEVTFYSSLQKLAALLSFETCVALDNFHRVRTEGRITVVYRFSPILEHKRVA